MAADGKGGIVAMDHDGDGEEEDVVGRSEADLQFDDTVGHIEDVLISDDFQSLQDKFLEGNYKYFDQDDENKLEYTKIHQIYIDTVENYLERQLKKRMPNFDMERFAQQLVNRNQEELEGDVFDVLLTFSDFVAFREMMVDYGASRSGEQVDLCVTGRNAVSLGLVGMAIGAPTAGGSKSATLQTLKAKHAAASANSAARGPASPSRTQPPKSVSSAGTSASSKTNSSGKSVAAITSAVQKIDLAVSSSSASPARASASSAKGKSTSSKPTPTPLTKSGAKASSSSTSKPK